MNATTVGIDLAKNVFEIAVADERGHIVDRQRLNRARFDRSSPTGRHAASSWKPVARPITTPGA